MYSMCLEGFGRLNLSASVFACVLPTAEARKVRFDECIENLGPGQAVGSPVRIVCLVCVVCLVCLVCLVWSGGST